VDRPDLTQNVEHRDVAGESLRRLVERWRAARTGAHAHAAEPLETMTPQAFRAVVAERLRGLERDLAEVRTRVNGLLFVVAGAVVTQVLLRFFA
jgi:hypothetical protein